MCHVSRIHVYTYTRIHLYTYEHTIFEILFIGDTVYIRYPTLRREGEQVRSLQLELSGHSRVGLCGRQELIKYMVVAFSLSLHYYARLLEEVVDNASSSDRSWM